MTPAVRRAETGARLSIGALSRATGIAVETLRTWESRYGFPEPERKPSGHRVYPVSSISRLRRIAEALARGHRAGQVVAATAGDLEELLETAAPVPSGLPHPPADGIQGLPSLLPLVAASDADRLTRALLGEYARLGPLEFLEQRVAPLAKAVGEEWQAGRLEIRHEHFLSERAEDLLRSLRMPFEDRATGPLVVFTTLPGEEHGLGLQMAALVLASAGCRILYLGTETPPAQTASLASDLNARAVAVSVSIANRGPATNAHLKRLRDLLPRRVALLVGGEGGPRALEGVQTMRDLRTLHEWGGRLVAGRAGGDGARRRG
jgi:methanogenic corrinoid protein MtbC1